MIYFNIFDAPNCIFSVSRLAKMKTFIKYELHMSRNILCLVSFEPCTENSVVWEFYQKRKTLKISTKFWQLAAWRGGRPGTYPSPALSSGEMSNVSICRNYQSFLQTTEFSMHGSKLTKKRILNHNISYHV